MDRKYAFSRFKQETSLQEQPAPKERRPEGRRLRFEVCSNQQSICRKANREVCLTNDRHHYVAQATRLLSLG